MLYMFGNVETRDVASFKTRFDKRLARLASEIHRQGGGGGFGTANRFACNFRENEREEERKPKKTIEWYIQFPLFAWVVCSPARVFRVFCERHITNEDFFFNTFMDDADVIRYVHQYLIHIKSVTVEEFIFLSVEKWWSAGERRTEGMFAWATLLVLCFACRRRREDSRTDRAPEW